MEFSAFQEEKKMLTHLLCLDHYLCESSIPICKIRGFLKKKNKQLSLVLFYFVFFGLFFLVFTNF